MGQLNLIFTTSRFVRWLLLGALQGVICFLTIFYSLGGPDVTGGRLGYETKYQFVSITLYTAIIFLVTLKLALNTQFWNWLTWFAYLVTSVGSYLLFMFVSNVWSLSGIYQQTGSLVSMPTFYLALLLSILGMFTVDLVLFSSSNLKDSLTNYIKYEKDISLQRVETLDHRVDLLQKSRENSVLSAFKEFHEPLLNVEMAEVREADHQVPISF